jgi:hypothetical protein
VGNDLPRFSDSIGLPFGPSRVMVGRVIDQSGQPAIRVFVVCFDSRSVVIFDPETRLKEAEVSHAFGYVGHFTDSYIGVIDLDQRRQTYAQIVLTVGVPTAPRGAK